MTRVSRLVNNFNAHNVLNVPTVDVYFQSSPGEPNVERGIEGLDFQVMANGVEIQTGRTPANGRVRVNLRPGATTILRIMGSEYQITSMGAFHTTDELRGVQQRLEVLGLYNGPIQADNLASNTYNNVNADTEQALLVFQADADLSADAMAGPISTRALRRATRNA